MVNRYVPILYYDLMLLTDTTQKFHDYLRGMVRRRAGREVSPSVGCIDSQSVNGTYRSRDQGKDSGKLVKGRKRHIVTDTQGLLPAVKVHPANRHDSKAAMDILRMLKPEFKRLKTIYADGVLKNVVKKELKSENHIKNKANR